ncbi:MAG: hypothetical protein R3B72_04230 [Polyangiaceae bacterium]
MPCARCSSPATEYFSDQGDPLCRVCYFAAQTQAQDDRAIASLASEAGMTPAQFRAAGGSAKLTEPESPTKTILSGSGVIAFGLALAAFEWFVLDRLHIILIGAILLVGVGMLGKGLMARRGA